MVSSMQQLAFAVIDGCFDLLLAYSFKSPVGSTTLAFGVRNLADAAPPRVYDSFLTYADPAYDFTGRYFFGRIDQKF